MSKKRSIFSLLAIFVVLATTGCIDEVNFDKQCPLSICTQGSTQAYFCPEDYCDEVVVNQINNATQSIHITIFSFTRDNIGDALIAAHNRGVDVKIVFDKGQNSQYSEYWRMKDLGMDVKLDGNSAYMHNKFTVIDGDIVMTGSYNWSDRATEENDENFVIIYSLGIASMYEQEFQEIYNEAE